MDNEHTLSTIRLAMGGIADRVSQLVIDAVALGIGGLDLKRQVEMLGPKRTAIGRLLVRPDPFETWQAHMNVRLDGKALQCDGYLDAQTRISSSDDVGTLEIRGLHWQTLKAMTGPIGRLVDHPLLARREYAMLSFTPYLGVGLFRFECPTVPL